MESYVLYFCSTNEPVDAIDQGHLSMRGVAFVIPNDCDGRT